MYWYVIHTKPKQELRAAQNLELQGYNIFLPTVPVQKLLKHIVHIIHEPLFARYLFIQLDQINSNWFQLDQREEFIRSYDLESIQNL